MAYGDKRIEPRPADDPVDAFLHLIHDLLVALSVHLSGLKVTRGHAEDEGQLWASKRSDPSRAQPLKRSWKD
jgi:hypothetical protein